MKVLAEQVEGKMNSRAEYPSNHSRQQRKWNVDNLTFSNCGDTGFANPQLQIAPSSMKHSLDYLNQVEIKRLKRTIDLLLCQTIDVTWSPTLGIVCLQGKASINGFSARLKIYNYLGICPRISLRIPAFAACGTFSTESIPQRKLHAIFILIA